MQIEKVDGFHPRVRGRVIPRYADDAAYESAAGVASVAGDMYYNTTISAIRIYNGSAWTSIGSSGFVGNEYEQTSSGSVSSDITGTPPQFKNMDAIISRLSVPGNGADRYMLMMMTTGRNQRSGWIYNTRVCKSYNGGGEQYMETKQVASVWESITDRSSYNMHILFDVPPVGTAEYWLQFSSNSGTSGNYATIGYAKYIAINLGP
jgi:hypothetical protein